MYSDKSSRIAQRRFKMVSLLLFCGVSVPCFSQATHLAFDTPLPSNHLNGFQLNAIKVNVENRSNGIVTMGAGATAAITLTLTGPGGYSNTMTHNASGGTYTFNYGGASLSSAGLYMMIANSGTLTSANQSLAITIAMVPPQQTILSGAFPNDSEGGLSDTTIEALEATVQANNTGGVAKRFAIDMHYYGFADPGLQSTSAFKTSVGTDLTDKIIPMVSWKCPAKGSGDTIKELAAPSSLDTNIANVAKALAGYPGPVIVRFFWEMNLISSTKNDETWECLGFSDGVTPTTAQITTAETDFQTAWGRIQSIFQSNGANNVVWVWNPGGGNDTAPNGTQNGGYTDAFYPGTTPAVGWSAVDWVGIDAYNRQDDAFQNTFFNGTPYNGNTGDASYGYGEQVAHGKPIIVAENGALYDNNDATHQISYFDSAVGALQAYFPAYLGYMYFASHATLDWSLTTSTPAPNGLTEFSNMMVTPYMNGSNPVPPVAWTTANFNDHVYVAPTMNSPTHGVSTIVSAEVGSTTFATAPTGTITFYWLNGGTLNSTAVTLSCSSSNYCKASTSATFGSTGQTTVSAVYSGDSNYAGGQSWPVIITVQ